MNKPNTTALVDGREPVANELLHLAMYPYGAYTSFVVEHGAIRGLDLHISRLEHASTTLFGSTVENRRIRHAIRQHISYAGENVRMRICLFNPNFDLAAPAATDTISILTTSTPDTTVDTTTPGAALHVRTTAAVRQLYDVKTISMLDQIVARRQAHIDGFDDVLFIEHDTVLEGTTWNVTLFNNTTMTATTPTGALLEGVTAALLGTTATMLGYAHERRPVKTAEMFTANLVVASNVTNPTRYVASCDQTGVKHDITLLNELHATFRSLPTQTP